MQLSAQCRKAAVERRSSVRERMEAAASGVGELDYLRHRQELLVQAALDIRTRESSGPGSGVLLEENALLLKKQLDPGIPGPTVDPPGLQKRRCLIISDLPMNCLHRPDTGLGSQDLDQQIHNLRLDQLSLDPLETDSRPSSGFYDLSDTASGSLSNSSNSVFSECLCSTADTEGRVLPTDEFTCCLDCDHLDHLVAGLGEDASSSVCPSLSAPHPPSLDSASTDLQSRFHCDMYCFPSPLHAVAVQNLLLLHVLGHGGWTRPRETASDCLPPDRPVTPVPPSPSWPTQKRLDGYIYNLLQRRPQSIRTTRPRTSVCTDPAKSVLRQASLCARQLSGHGSGSGYGTLRGTSSPLRQRSEDNKTEEQQIQNSNMEMVQSGLKVNCNSTQTIQNEVLMMKKNSQPLPMTPIKDIRVVDGPSASPKDVQPPCLTAEDGASQPRQEGESPGLEPTGQGSSSESQDKAGGEGGWGSRMVNLKSILAENTKQCNKNVKIKANQMSDPTEMENTSHRSHRRSISTRYRTSEQQGHVRFSRRPSSGLSGRLSSGRLSSRLKRLPVLITENQVMDKNGVQLGVSRQRHHGNQHHYHGGPRHSHRPHHGRDQVVVVAKPKHKRSDYRRLRAVTDVLHDKAFRHAQNCQRKENVYLSSPYSCVAGSDSEYSAECASLFHSTVMDTSEDEKSDYTTNCFGDGEFSSNSDTAEESSMNGSIKDRGGASLMNRRQGQVGGGSGAKEMDQEVTQTKAIVKIKASHNLKKKILQFRGGSLKLMTTV